jgi:two-component system OmpR family response regulator
MMLTARNAPDDIKEALALGASDYLAKPFTDAQLLGRLARLLRPRPPVVANESVLI